MNRVVQRLLDTVGQRAGVPFAVTLPDGSRHDCGGPQPAFTLHLRTEQAVVALATRGHVGLLEA